MPCVNVKLVRQQINAETKNPDGWGFDGISMTERNILEQDK